MARMIGLVAEANPAEDPLPRFVKNFNGMHLFKPAYSAAESKLALLRLAYYIVLLGVKDARTIFT